MDPVGIEDRRRRFEDVAALVYEPLQRYLRRRIDPVGADDVLGDALLVLWRRLDDIPADAALAWSYGVARRCLANHVRAAARQDALVARLARLPGPSVQVDLGVVEALAQLSEADREVLHLWAWEQLPAREIAQVLGISANAASIRLHRATKKLRKQLTSRKDDGHAGHLDERQDREAGR